MMLGLALGGPASAQPRRPAPVETADDGGAPLGSPERREQIKKKIRTMRAFTLTEELSLDEPTAGRLFPVLARFDDETDKLLQRRVELNRKLRHADALRDPRQIERLIDDAIANQRAFRELEDRKISELRRVLPPPQMAKLLVVLPALERKIQNQLRKAIVGKGAARMEDDDLEPEEQRPPRRAAPPVRSNAPGNTPPCDPRSESCR
ncbi:MAG TPA: hypothetical protein VGC42_11980 [Kofleriaceae bacterium]